MPLKRYIHLSDTILDREKISTVYRDPNVPERVHVTFENMDKHYFDGDDGQIVWDAFTEEGPGDPNYVWKEKDEG